MSGVDDLRCPDCRTPVDHPHSGLCEAGARRGELVFTGYPGRESGPAEPSLPKRSGDAELSEGRRTQEDQR